MKCPNCKHDQNVVTETRSHGDSIYRRRRCKKCHTHFVSIETNPPDLKMPTAAYSRPEARLKPGQTQYQGPEIKAKIGKNSTGKDLQKVWG